MLLHRPVVSLLALALPLATCVGAHAATPGTAPAASSAAHGTWAPGAPVDPVHDAVAQATMLLANGQPEAAIVVLVPYVAANPNDRLASQTLTAARITMLEAEIRRLLAEQADQKQLLTGSPDYEAAKARADRSVSNRLDVVEAFLAQRRLAEAVEACNAILRDHPQEPATLILKLRILHAMAERERDALEKEKAARHDVAINDVLGRTIYPKDKPPVARTVWIFDEDLAEAERQKMRAKMQERLPAVVYDRAGIRELLRPLFAAAGINYIILDSALSDETLTLDVHDESIENLLGIIAKQVKVNYHYTGNTVFVTGADSDVLVTEIIRLQAGLSDVETEPQLQGSTGGAGGGAGGGSGGGASTTTPNPGQALGGLLGGAGGGAGGGGAGGAGGQSKSDLERLLDKIPQIVNDWPAQGQLYLERKSNSLIVRSTPAGIAEVKRLVRSLDYNSVQVLIETRFLNLSDSAARDLGFNWSTGGVVPVGKDSATLSGPGNATADNPLRIANGAAAGSTGLLTQLIYDSKHLMDFTVQFAAQEQKGQASTLTSPRILTLNNAKGIISIERDISYISGYQNQAVNTPVNNNGNTGVTVNTQNALVPQFSRDQERISLRITPSVARNGDIINLVVEPEVRELLRAPREFSFGVPNGTTVINNPINEPPVFDTRRLFTRMQIKSGQTIALGGLTTERSSQDVNGVPGISRIPVFGSLFRRTTNTSARQNLVILVTATLIDPQGSAYSDEVRRMRDTSRVVIPPEDRAAQAAKDATSASEAAAAAQAAQDAAKAGSRPSPWKR